MMNPQTDKSLAELVAEMKHRWFLLMHTLGVTDLATAQVVFDDLVTHYTENGRYYHNLAHIRNVLNAVEELGDYADDFAAVRLAAWFHDIIYEIGAKDNEAQSADYAAAQLRRLRVDEQVLTHMVAQILATKHIELSADTDCQIVMDADLTSFAFTGEAFWQGSLGIRREFGHIDDETYVNGRVNVLKFFQSKAKMFQTDVLHTALEAQARQNIAAEMAVTQSAIELIRQYPRMSMDLCRLGFLLGDWQATSAIWQDGAWVTGGETAVTIQPILDGAHIQETAVYTFPDFSFQMITLYSFDSQRLVYRLTTLTDDGTLGIYEGHFDDDGLLVEDTAGSTSAHRHRVRLIPPSDDPDRFEAIIATRNDATQSWHDSFKISYQRVTPTAS